MAQMHGVTGSDGGLRCSGPRTVVAERSSTWGEELIAWFIGSSAHICPAVHSPVPTMYRGIIIDFEGWEGIRTRVLGRKGLPQPQPRSS